MGISTGSEQGSENVTLISASAVLICNIFYFHEDSEGHGPCCSAVALSAPLQAGERCSLVPTALSGWAVSPPFALLLLPTPPCVTLWHATSCSWLDPGISGAWVRIPPRLVELSSQSHAPVSQASTFALSLSSVSIVPEALVPHPLLVVSAGTLGQ